MCPSVSAVCLDGMLNNVCDIEFHNRMIYKCIYIQVTISFTSWIYQVLKCLMCFCTFSFWTNAEFTFFSRYFLMIIFFMRTLKILVFFFILGTVLIFLVCIWGRSTHRIIRNFINFSNEINPVALFEKLF